MGAFILQNFPKLKVDVHNPDIRINLEIREHAYAYHENIPGAGGMPVGTNGKTALLLSGGIGQPCGRMDDCEKGSTVDRRSLSQLSLHQRQGKGEGDRSV